MEILGIDIGGTGIKGAPVDTERGVLLAERYRIPTPQPARPDAVSDVVAEVAKYFEWSGPVGCTFPAVIKNGTRHPGKNGRVPASRQATGSGRPDRTCAAEACVHRRPRRNRPAPHPAQGR